MNKLKEIREEAEYKKNHSQLARHCLYLLSELDAVQEYFRIKQGQVWVLDAERKSLQQQLKQAIEALESIGWGTLGVHDDGSFVMPYEVARKVLSLIRGEVGNETERKPIEIEPFDFSNRIEESDLPPFEVGNPPSAAVPSGLEDDEKTNKGAIKMEKGLYEKYTLINNETGEEVQENFFILKPEKDEAARKALLAYAEATDNEQLADDLRNWVTPVVPQFADPIDRNNF